MADVGRGGQALERLTFFSDAVFAIAMTLLIIEIRVPHLEVPGDAALADALLALLPNYIGFVVSFAVVARFWAGHHRIMGLLRAPPAGLVGWNLAFLLTIAFMPFPTAVLSDYVELRAAAMFYAGWLVVTGLLNAALIQVALREPALLHADVAADDVALARRNRWLPVAVGVIALGAAAIAPLLAVAVLVVLTPLLALAIRRRR